jgi:hypothetical protein
VRFFSGTFLMALETYGFPYRAIKNVANLSRYPNSRLNYFAKLWKKT